MKKMVLSAFTTLTLLSAGMADTALACTDIRLTAKDGTVMVGRTMEFSMDLKTELRTSGRDRVFTSMAPDGKPGLTWKTKYGYVFMGALGVDAAIDGMNEAGLSFEALYLPGYAKYQTITAAQDAQALSYMNVGDWVLGNFKTVDEVRNAITTVFVTENKIAGMGDMVFPLHFSIYDASGKGIVLEYIDGKLAIHDNKVGVMTNAPSYDWHVTNLTNYIRLRPENPNPVMAAGITFVATGQGSGMIGLPGDISPPSRFVKMAVLKDVVIPATDAVSLQNLEEHILNNVDIPIGLAREPNNGSYTTESTEWTVFKDLTHKVFYYHTYNDLSLRSVDLAKLDFSEKAPRLKMPIASKQSVLDMTDAMLKAKG